MSKQVNISGENRDFILRLGHAAQGDPEVGCFLLVLRVSGCLGAKVLGWFAWTIAYPRSWTLSWVKTSSSRGGKPRCFGAGKSVVRRKGQVCSCGPLARFRSSATSAAVPLSRRGGPNPLITHMR